MFTSLPLRRDRPCPPSRSWLSSPRPRPRSPHAKASQVDDPTTAAATAELSKEAWAAGEKLYGEKVTADLALSAYWTPERMKAAEPVDGAPFLEEAYKRYEAIDAQRQEQAKINEEKGIKPPEQGPELLVKPDSTANGQTTAQGRRVQPEPRHQPPDRPHQRQGLLQPQRRRLQCSASVINSEGKDTVWTAGHCVNAGQTNGAWATNWTFVPAYDDDLANPRPYGTWSARQLWTKTAWKNNADFAEDMGVAIMNTRNGQPHRLPVRRPRLARQHRQERLRVRVRLPGRGPVRRRQPDALLPATPRRSGASCSGAPTRSRSRAT